MKKITKIMSGVLATIMITLVVAPLLSVMPVKASITFEHGIDIGIFDDISFGTKDLAEHLMTIARNHYDVENVDFIVDTLAVGDSDPSIGNIYWDASEQLEDVNDYDMDVDFFTSVLSDVKNNPGLTLYEKCLRNIRIKTENAGQAPIKSFGTTSIEDYINAVKAKFGEDVIVYPIWYFSGTKDDIPTANDTTHYFAACDYDLVNSRFIYYTIVCTQQDFKPDHFFCSVFSSQKFLAPLANKALTISYSSDHKCSAISVSSTATDGSSLCENIAKLLGQIIGKDENNIFTNIFNNGGVLSDTEQNKLSVINQLLQYGKDDAGNSNVSTPNNIYMGISYKDAEKTPIEWCIGVYNSSHSEVYNGWDNRAILQYSEQFEINDGFLAFGDEKSATGKNAYVVEGSTQNAALADVCAQILSGAVNADPTNVVGKCNEILNQLKTYDSCGEGTFVYTLLSTYAKNLDSAIEKSYIEQLPVAQDELNLPDNASNYEILNAMCIYSIQCYVAGISMPTTLQYNGKAYSLNTDSLGTIPNESDTKISIKTLWSTLSPMQQAVLSTAYYGKCDYLNIPAGKRFGYIIQKHNDTDSAKYIQSKLGSGGLPLQATPDYTNELIAKYNDADLYNTGMVTNVARNANVLAHYVVTSALYNVNIEQASDLYSVYNYNLENLIKEQWNYKNTSTSDYQQDFFAWLPKTMELFGDAGVNYTTMLEDTNNWTRLVNLLYNVEYAFETLSFSQFGEENNYTTEDVLKWLSGEEAKGDASILPWLENVANQRLDSYEAAVKADSLNLDGDGGFSIDLLRSIIELHDMCEFLGIGENDWSDCIKGYLNVYNHNTNFFEALRANPKIYSLLEQKESSDEEPLAMFFTLESKTMSDDWAKGFAMSALYVPMETNLYDASSIAFLNDSEWISDFYYKYAFYRKALYISTDNNAIVNQFVSGAKANTRVATLNDLLNYDRDIILTVDDNFYNANEINSVISSIDYTGLRNTADTTDTAKGFDKIGNWVGDLMSLSASDILKTGASSYYSKTLADHSSKFGEDSSALSVDKNMMDLYLLSKDEILGKNTDGVFDSYEYTPKVSYGVVSAIYRSAQLYNETLKSLASDNAIFKSSKGICATPGSTSSDWRSIYNYAMLSNLSEQMKNDTASTLDLSAPIFCDLFGNIVTESGLVIIPAATNATLCGKNWTPCTVGFSEYYNNGNMLNVKDFSDEFVTWAIGKPYTTNVQGSADENTIDTSNKSEHTNAGGYFEVARDGSLILAAKSLTSGNLTGVVQWNVLNKNSTVIKQLFFNDAYYEKASKIYGPITVNLVLETMRGCPIEYIDYSFEGLDGNQNISRFGVYAAYKLENLIDTVYPDTSGQTTGGNPIVTDSSLVYINGVEYIMLYVFKVIFAGMIVILVIQLYMDAVSRSLGLKSVGKFLITCLMIFMAFTIVPTVNSWSYYNANKNLLTSETGRIAMLNYVKAFNKSEIGTTQVRTPETQTDLYLKLDDVKIEWWNVIGDVLFGNTYKTVSELYKEQATDHPYANFSNIVTKGGGMYISVQDVFDSTDINYRPTSSMLTNTMYTYSTDSSGVVATNAPTSYTLPYYVFLDQLIANVNEYNASRDITAYSWAIGANGHIMTYDIINPYLTSAEFLDDGMDILGLDRILKDNVNRPLYNFAYTDDDLDKMSYSLWYPSDRISAEERLSKIDELYEFARSYVADNADIMGKVPDEVFIKSMALQLAIKYNKLFNVSYGNSVEIMNIDTRDIIRFMIANDENVYKYYSYSFARFTYEQGGGICIAMAAALIFIMWLTGYVRTGLKIVILVLLCINCLLRKLVFRKESKCIEGYLISCACLALTNYAYAIFFKVALMVPGFGLGTAMSLLIAILVQLAYCGSLVGVAWILKKDWKNSGFNEFKNVGSSLVSDISQAHSMVVNKLVSKHNEAFRATERSRFYAGDDYDRDSIERMHERDQQREENGTYSTI